MNDSRSDGPPGSAGGVVIGVDIGGTKTHGIRLEDGVVTRELTTGSANVQNVSRATAASSLAELLTGLHAGDARAVVVGSGGVDTGEDAERLRGLIAPHTGRAQITVVHDTRLILAAGETTTGIAVIAGTGSAVWGVNDAGTEARAGGWGYLLGDEGSGYWFGREAVRHTLRRADMGLPVDELGAALLETCGLTLPTELIAHFHGGTDRRYWADKSRVVFRAAADGHAPSRDLIELGAAYLVRDVLQVASRLGVDGPVVLGGGLAAHQPALRASLTRDLGTEGITDVRALATEPVHGAFRLAPRPAG
ncbi:N-acetylglucosamine kinase [Kocuria sp. M1R5S2]|uniref:N-acetylglucosamine kinase n=1 Tax=Kocuria rhizosphaerae TaxID=3376285 RepID=UPI003797385A